jgi:hypothetical protein
MPDRPRTVWCLRRGTRARYLEPSRSARHPRVRCPAHLHYEQVGLGTLDPDERAAIRQRTMRGIVRRARRAPYARA